MSSTELRPSFSSNSSKSSSTSSNITTQSSSTINSSNSSKSSTSNITYTKLDSLHNSPTYNHKLLPRHLQDPLTRDYPIHNPNQPLNVEECLRRKPLAWTFGGMLESRRKELENAGKAVDLVEKEARERRLRDERRKDLERIKAELRAGFDWR